MSSLPRYEVRRIEDLRPAPYNPRIELKPGMPAWEKLARSLDEFSLVQPIVWNEATGHVVGGHQRLAILKHQQMTEVMVAVVNLSLEREQALNIALNNAELAGDWDSTRLIDVLKTLQHDPAADATLTGFDAAQLRSLVLDPLSESPLLPGSEEHSSEEKVTVHFEIPLDAWADYEEQFNQFVQTVDVAVHVHVPQGS